jgi:diguanylate cyclase (GGDEF)-like protein
MALNSTQFREAIKPQDMVAMVITLLGLAIVFFLDDAIIKLIGGSIAVLGMVALYVTIKQRVNDQIQLRTRRTTLPPPAFKTRVTHDPSTSTKRILFDDFQATFAPADDDIPADDPLEGFMAPPAGIGAVTPVSASKETRSTAESAATQRDGIASSPALVAERPIESDSAFVDTSGESFRVVKQKEEAPVARGASPAPVSTPSSIAGVPADTPARSDKRSSERRPPDPLPVPAMEKSPATPAPSRNVPEQIVTPPTLEEVRQELTTPTRKQAQFILEDLISDGDEDARGSEPRGEFVRLVGQVLNAIARSIQARSIIFFWVNLEKGHLIPEAKVTTGNVEVRSGSRIPLGTDVVSQIARSGVPEVITDISPSAERELISYYTGPASTRSFVGVPVFFRREVVGVLAADSAEESGFDESSVATLAEYTRLISGLIRSYTEKYDLHLIARTLDAFEKMSQDFSGAAPSPIKTGAILAQQIAELFDTLYVAVVLFDEGARDWRIAACASETLDGQLSALQPDMRTSLVGRSTRYAEEILLEQIGQEIRFAPGEPLSGGGTFLAIPLVATTKCYGAIAIEHPAPAAYIPRDIDLMRDLAHYAAMAIEVFNTNRAIESHVILDEVTGLYNSEFLLNALEREIARSRDFKHKLSFALISIDMPASLRAENSPEIEEIIAASVGAVIENSIRSYDTVGRYSTPLFGVVLVNRSDQDAYIWAEKLRKDVASRILALGQRKSAVTISVGISDLSAETSTRDTMVNGAKQALEKARSGDGNAVILY